MTRGGGFQIHHERDKGPEVRKVWPILLTFVLITLIVVAGCVGAVTIVALLVR